MYVHQLNHTKVKLIEETLRKTITDTGLYTASEVETHVQRGLNSKVHDLMDTINIRKILNENGVMGMTKAQKQLKLFEIHGVYFKENEDSGKREIIDDISFFHDGVESLIDHQRIWYDESLKLGYISGELDEDKTIRANYNGDITDIQMMEIVNSRTLMDTPLNELFSTAISDFIKKS